MTEIKGRKSRIINSFARTYHDLQKTQSIIRIAYAEPHYEAELEANGLMDVTYEYRPDGSVKRKKMELKKDVDTGTVNQVKQIVEEIREYQMLAASEVRFKKMEAEMLKDAEDYI